MHGCACVRKSESVNVYLQERDCLGERDNVWGRERMSGEESLFFLECV